MYIQRGADEGASHTGVEVIFEALLADGGEGRLDEESTFVAVFFKAQLGPSDATLRIHQQLRRQIRIANVEQQVKSGVRAFVKVLDNIFLETFMKTSCSYYSHFCLLRIF